MGGGDLNLKKSWHPSTMRNVEKVWKAEQRDEEERKRIAELKKEIDREKDREELQKLGEDRGVLEKKDGNRLDWMYRGATENVDREEYLLGRQVDKQFEREQQQQQAEATASGSAQGNCVEYDCTPVSIFAGSGNEQVDLVRKLQEDPLVMIRKKETETIKRILDNPMKMKQIQRMAKRREAKVEKKRERKNSEKERKSGKDLDRILAEKLSSLRNKMGSEKPKKDKRRTRDSSSDSDSNNHRRRERSSQSSQRGKRSRSRSRSRDNWRRHRDSKNSSSRQPVHQPPKKLSAEEMERRRQEMMTDAKVRDLQRSRNVARMTAEQRREEEQQRRTHDTSFIRKQLNEAAAKGSVEGRIRSNLYNIQRSGGAMDKNFARR